MYGTYSSGATRSLYLFSSLLALILITTIWIEQGFAFDRQEQVDFEDRQIFSTILMVGASQSGAASSHSEVVRMNLPENCQNPVVTAQFHVNSEYCGGTTCMSPGPCAPVVCPNFPSTTSVDLLAATSMSSSQKFVDVWVTAMDFLAFQRAPYPVHLMVSCSKDSSGGSSTLLRR